ncbi:MAG TPA: Ig-like domain-containing protein [Symbiobacteriaceae bacterium]
MTIHDYENGAVKSVDDPKLVKQLIDKLSEARPAPESSPPDVQGFQYMMWLTLGDRRQIHLIVWPGGKVDLIDPIAGSAWQAPGLGDVMTPLLPSSDQDKKYIGRMQAIQFATAGTSGAKVGNVLLVESFHVRGREPLTVWQIPLSGSDISRALVVIDAATGEILDVLQGNGSSFISSVSPAQGVVTKATEESEIKVYFTRDMNPSTLNEETIQIVEAKHSSVVTDRYRYEYRKKTLVLRPVNPAFSFGSGNTITVTITGTVQDATGQSMGKDYSWSFRT